MTSQGGFDAGVAALRRFWFDVALSASPTTLPSLLAFAHPDRILFGSDSPYAPNTTVNFMASSLDSHRMRTPLRQAINRGNAEKLVPRLAKRS
ncbi:hypothetical protein ACQP1W_27650 [Spirillospora sp. CA-255316]